MTGVLSIFAVYCVIQIFWIAVSSFWLVRRKDELPLIISLFLFYVFSFRFWALLEGWASPVNLSNFGFENVTLDSAGEAEGIAVLGQSVLMLVYLWAQKSTTQVPRWIDLGPVGKKIRTLAFLLILFCVPLALLARRSVSAQAAAGKSLAFEVTSYLTLFPLALVGIAILLGTLWRSGALSDFFLRCFAVLSFVVIAFITFQPSLRFQFLGWVIAVTVIVASGKSVIGKAWLLSTGLLLAVTAFAIAGALRSSEDADADLQQNAWERFAFAQDANMLDGFVLLRQVYPNLLNYSYGGEHLEILARPVPRAWWRGKPVGGYMNKLGIMDVNSGFTLGISPSLFGSFYQEGAGYGVILLSAVYGYAFGRLIRLSARLRPFTGLLIRGMLCAALIPLFRGGDLPGIYAWFGMSFWPIVLVLFCFRRDLFESGQPLPVFASSTVAERSRQPV